jgi:hypothetical protein
VEDLVCDPVTYAPLEAILAKDAFNGLYEAFEVETGTCPLVGEPLTITLTPAAAVNEAGTEHSVTATVSQAGGGVEGVLVSFEVVSGPNAGEASDPGECTPNADCTTDSDGEVSWTYAGTGGVGTDTIEACFEDENGEEQCARAEKTWVDTTPPTVPTCAETTNPSGRNVPRSGPNAGNSGQNPDGFYELAGAIDSVDPNPVIFVVDKGKDGIFGTADDTTFGPFPNGTKIKYVEANGAEPSISPGPGDIDWQIKGNGDFGIYSEDAAGNPSAHVQCHVAPPPKQ